MAQRTAQKLLIIGWDAADWMLIDPLLASGKLPHLSRLLSAGTRSDLRTLEPALSPLLWTAIATGKTADKHAILNFVEPKPDASGLRISSSTSRRTKALWNILSQSGLSTNVVGWYASHPAEPIRGTIVSNMLQEGEPASPTAPWPLPPAAVHPAPFAPQIAAARQRARSFPRTTLERLAPRALAAAPTDPRLTTLANLMAYAASIEHAAVSSLSSGAWDCTMVFFDAIDTVGHHFMQYLPPRMTHVTDHDVHLFGDVMPNVYQWHDEALGRLLAAAGSNVTVILLSDHGFYSDHRRPVLVDLPPERRAELESSWHRPRGVLAMSGPGIRPAAHLANPSILDIAPTALTLLGLPVASDFDGRILSESLTTASISPPIPSWDTIDGDSGLHPADARQDPFEAVDAIKQLVDLGYMAALPGDVQGQLDLVSRESRFNLAVVYKTTNRHAAAVPLFQSLVTEKPAESRYALNLAQCLYAQANFPAAAAALQEFLTTDPASLEATLLLAAALAMQGHDQQAVAEISRVETLAAKRPDLALAIGDSLCTAHAFTRALHWYQSALSHDSSSTAAHIGLARAQLGQSRYEPAAGHALDALDLSQTLPEAHYLLGAALAWYGDLENASRSFQLAIQHEPNYLDAHRFLSLCARKAPDAALANAHAARAAELASAAPPLREMPFGPRAFARHHNLNAL